MYTDVMRRWDYEEIRFGRSFRHHLTECEILVLFGNPGVEKWFLVKLVWESKGREHQVRIGDKGWP